MDIGPDELQHRTPTLAQAVRSFSSQSQGTLSPNGDSLSENKQMILDVIRENPGITIQGVADIVGLSHSTCSYHLNTLERGGHVAQERRGRVLHHFPAGRHRDPEVRLQHIYADERKRQILDCIRGGGHLRTTINGLATALGMPYGFVKRTLREFHDEGLVHLSRRNYQYSLEVIRDIDALLKLIEE